MPQRDAAVKADYFVSAKRPISYLGLLFLSVLYTPGAIFQMLFVPKLRPLERALLQVLSDALPEAERKKLRWQLRENNINSREGPLNAPENVFQRWTLVPLPHASFRPFVNVPGHFVLLATIKFKLDGKSITFDLFSLGGVLHSLQFDSRVDDYRTDIEILRVDTEPVVLDENGRFLRFV